MEAFVTDKRHFDNPKQYENPVFWGLRRRPPLSRFRSLNYAGRVRRATRRAPVAQLDRASDYGSGG